MRTVITILLLACSVLLHAQVKSIDKYSLMIDSMYRAGKLVEKSFPNMSLCGGSLHGYYHQGRLVYIHTVYGGDMGYQETHYFIRDSVLLKTVKQEIMYIAAADMESYCQKHALPNGDCDLSGLPKETKTVKIYFSSNAVYSWHNGARLSMTSKEQEDNIKATVSCYTQLLSELLQVK